MWLNPKILEEINNIRAEKFNKEPLEEIPKGLKWLTRDCPLTNAFRDCGVTAVTRTTAWHLLTGMNAGREAFPLPNTLSVFTQDFDSGHYPQLIED